jgi:hypothetical protein
MKKVFIFTIIATIIVTSIIYGYRYYNLQKNPIYDTSDLSSVTVNGKNYKTTGAIPTEDASSQMILYEIVKLGSMGTITTDKFQITTESPGVVRIRLLAPYDQSKEAALTYLKSNGYGNIPQDQVIFEEVR